MHDMTRQQCEALLDSADVGHLAVVDEGEPYVTPISFVRSGPTIMMRTAPGRRLDVIRRSPRACLEVSAVDDKTGDWRSVLVWGDCREARDERSETEAVALLLDKYKRLEGPVTAWTVPELLPGAAVVLLLPIQSITGRTSGSGEERRTRPGRL